MNRFMRRIQMLLTRSDSVAKKRILSARHYQPRNSPLRILADGSTAAIARDVKATLLHLSKLLPPHALQLARAGDWHNLREGIDWTHFRQAMKSPFNRIGRLREEAARFGERRINGTFSQARRRIRFRKQMDLLGIPYGKAYMDGESADVSNIDKASGDQYTFDLYDEATQARIRQAQDDLIQQLEQQARDTIAEVVLAGAEAGLGPEEIVDDIRSTIGLTARQAQATVNYQQMLYDLDPTALERRLRNGNYDDLLQEAIDTGADLSQTMIDKMTADYVDNYLDYRAETIARTEATRAVNSGLQDSYQQAIDRGVFPADAVTQFWRVALAENICPVCRSIPEMNPDGVAVGELFDSIDGPVDAPPDPHPSCQCDIEMVTDLDKVPDTTAEAA